MKLIEICKEYNNRYDEIFDRINKNMKNFEYATYSESVLDGWTIFDEKQLAITTFGNYMNEINTKTVKIEAKYLENDKVFNEWLNTKCSQRKEKEKNEKESKEKLNEEKERALYEKLKKKYQ
jgi:hypothetical protein